jgi:Methyltransferase FkbM domain
METLDDALEGKRPSLIKLDVEGYESEILCGAVKTLSDSELKAIIVEDRSSVVVDALQAAGFVEQNYEPFTRCLAREQTQRQKHNALFVRDINSVQQRLKNAARVKVFNKYL